MVVEPPAEEKGLGLAPRAAPGSAAALFIENEALSFRDAGREAIGRVKPA